MKPLSLRPVTLGGLLLCGLACSPAPPTVQVSVRQGSGAPALAGLARLQMIVRTCGSTEPIFDQSLSVRGEASPPVELDILPGTEMYVHLKGWLDCAGTECTPPEQATVNDCVCPSEAGQPPQILRSEGCTDWFAAEVDRLATVTLGDRLGLCPPPITGCTAQP